MLKWLYHISRSLLSSRFVLNPVGLLDQFNLI